MVDALHFTLICTSEYEAGQYRWNKDDITQFENIVGEVEGHMKTEMKRVDGVPFPFYG